MRTSAPSATSIPSTFKPPPRRSSLRIRASLSAARICAEMPNRLPRSVAMSRFITVMCPGGPAAGPLCAASVARSVAGAEAAVCAWAAKPTSKAHNHSAGTNGFSQGVSFDKRAINCITFEHGRECLSIGRRFLTQRP